MESDRCRPLEHSSYSDVRVLPAMEELGGNRGRGESTISEEVDDPECRHDSAFDNVCNICRCCLPDCLALHISKETSPACAIPLGAELRTQSLGKAVACRVLNILRDNYRVGCNGCACFFQKFHAVLVQTALALLEFVESLGDIGEQGVGWRGLPGHLLLQKFRQAQVEGVTLAQPGEHGSFHFHDAALAEARRATGAAVAMARGDELPAPQQEGGADLRVYSGSTPARRTCSA